MNFGHDLVFAKDRQPPVHIGTSGWNYPHWKQHFYPTEIRQADWLGFYAQHFDTVEVNYSFYRIPSREAVERWIGMTPNRFRFAIKLWRGITHFRKLKNCRGLLQNFFDAFSSLPPRRRAPLLIQLPPNQGRDLAKLDEFFQELREVSAPSRWKVAVEFRNESWLCEDTYRLLNRHRAALCLHDMIGRADVDEPNDVKFVYMRRHGPSDESFGGYSPKQIQRDARRIRKWLGEGRSVFVYYNNDAEGYAILNAMQLHEAVGP